MCATDSTAQTIPWSCEPAGSTGGAVDNTDSANPTAATAPAATSLIRITPPHSSGPFPPVTLAIPAPPP